MMTSPSAVWALPNQRISVVPVEGGWSVQAGLSGAPLMFLSGGKAEEKAKAMGQWIAAAGRDAQVLIHDRSKALVGTIRYFANEDQREAKHEQPRDPSA